jgi:hypothetical protein
MSRRNADSHGWEVPAFLKLKRIHGQKHLHFENLKGIYRADKEWIAAVSEHFAEHITAQ